MKNYRYVVGALIAALSIISCQKVNSIDEPEVISDGQAFELFASVTETKTSIGDNFAVSWNDSDKINVFHAESSSTNFITDGAFSIDDADNGHFVGTVSGVDAEKSYDWYAFYPYDSNVVTPASTNKGYVTVGGKGQSQNGYGSYAHIAGRNMPLYGKQIGVKGDTTPEIAMKQICSVIEVTVKNMLTDPLTISDVSFTGTENIVGTYYINFVGESPVLTASGDDYVSNKVSLSISGGSEIGTNETAKFYIAVKPFTAAAGSQLKIAVNGYEKTINLTNSTSFTSGKIKKINFTYDYEAGETLYYERVNSAITDWSGEYLLVAPDVNMALSEFSTTSTVYGIGAGVNIASDKIESTLATNAYKLTIASASEGSSYVIKRGGEYLTWKSGNSLETVNTESNNSRWTISCKAGNVLIKNVSDNTREIWWNNGSPRFACYTGKSADNSYKATALFKLGGGGTPVPPATKYTITVPNNLTGGTVSSDKSEAEAGETVTITAAPANGYQLSTLTSDVLGETLDGNVLTFTMPEANVTVSASFEEITLPSSGTITITADNSGITGSYPSETKSFTVSGFSFSYNLWMKNSGIQVKASTQNALFNTSAFPGEIKTITFTTSSGKTPRQISVYGGNGEKPSALITSPTLSEIMVFDFSGKGYTYFTMDTPSNACYFSSIVITYGEASPAKSLTSIAVKTAPTKLEYTAGEKFDPTGLVITKTMSDETTEDVAYADHASDFSFDPSLTTALDASNTEVTITYGEKTVKQTITVTSGAGGTPKIAKFIYVNLYSDITDTGTKDVDGCSDIVNDVTITYSKVDGTNNPKYYANGSSLRIYKKSTMTFTVPSGMKIKKIEAVGTTTWVNDALAADSGTVSNDTKSWSGDASTVVFTITGSFRFSEIDVTYE